MSIFKNLPSYSINLQLSMEGFEQIQKAFLNHLRDFYVVFSTGFTNNNFYKHFYLP